MALNSKGKPIKKHIGYTPRRFSKAFEEALDCVDGKNVKPFRWAKIGRINFPTGHSIDVHAVKDGNVFYQAWLPNEVSKPMLHDLRKMDIADFEKEVAKRMNKPKERDFLNGGDDE